MAFGRGAAPYTAHRMPLYLLLWALSVVLLALTGFRVHHTKSTAGFYDPIVVELLVTSALTILWIPYAMTTMFGQRATAGGTTANTAGRGARHPGLRNELGGNTILWIMWLVGAAIFTNTWPSKAFCGPGAQCQVLTAILAIAWSGFGIFTIIKILSLMQHAAAYGGAYHGAGVGAGAGAPGAAAGPGTAGRVGEKPAVAAGAANVPSGAGYA